LSYLKKDKINSLADAARAFQDHEGVSLAKTNDWSEQFGERNQTLALKILNNVKYYSGPKIREMVENLVQKVCEKLNCHKRQLIFIPIGNPYEGSNIIARALRDCPGIRTNQIKPQTELANIPKNPRHRAIVLLDIFSGTGEQMDDWWMNMETLLLPWIEKSITLILGILAVNYKAKKVFRAIPAELVCISSLDKRHNMLSDISKVFLESEKKQIKSFCNKTGCSSKYLYGRGQCGLLIAFKYGCPNNSLPILWYQSNNWKNIFLRRAL
jgi:hypothetical protein